MQYLIAEISHGYSGAQGDNIEAYRDRSSSQHSGDGSGLKAVQYTRMPGLVPESGRTICPRIDVFTSPHSTVRLRYASRGTKSPTIPRQ